PSALRKEVTPNDPEEDRGAAPAVEVRHEELLTNPTSGARLGSGPSPEENPCDYPASRRPPRCSPHPAATSACSGPATTPTSCSRAPASATARSWRRSTGAPRGTRSRPATA